MANVWKIAPGEGAEDWEESQQYGCIGLGWMRLPDYRVFTDREEILAALIEAYPAGQERGNRGGAATSIWYFVHDVGVGDIVIANGGRSRVVGIGVIGSGYLTPDAPNNPIPRPITDYDMWRRHARRVDWRIVQPVDIGETYFFSIGTVCCLAPERVLTIRQAYVRHYPGLAGELAGLFDDAVHHPV